MSLEKLEAADRAQDIEALSSRLAFEVSFFYPDAETFTREQLKEAVGRAWLMVATVVMNTVAGRRNCRVCGCWELEACDGGCSWVARDLCSVCGHG